LNYAIFFMGFGLGMVGMVFVLGVWICFCDWREKP
jgi:hypothetical protein